MRRVGGFAIEGGPSLASTIAVGPT